MSTQPTGFQQPMHTGFQPQRAPTSLSSAPTGMGGNMSFLNQPPQQSSFRPSGLNPQMTGYPGGGASGLMSQQTGFQGGMMSQPTGMGMGIGGGMGMGGGLMSQPTGMGALRPQPTGFHDPRLQSMMQSFMPSNLSQVREPQRAYSGILPNQYLHSPSQHLAHPSLTRLRNNSPSLRLSRPFCRTHRSKRPKSLGRYLDKRRRTTTRFSAHGTRMAMASSPVRQRGKYLDKRAWVKRVS